MPHTQNLTDKLTETTKKRIIYDLGKMKWQKVNAKYFWAIFTFYPKHKEKAINDLLGVIASYNYCLIHQTTSKKAALWSGLFRLTQ